MVSGIQKTRLGPIASRVPSQIHFIFSSQHILSQLLCCTRPSKKLTCRSSRYFATTLT